MPVLQEHQTKHAQAADGAVYWSLGETTVMLTCLTDLHCEDSLINSLVAQGTQCAIAGKV